MLTQAREILKKYIEGKDQDKFHILEEIYLPDGKVNFTIETDTISFPSEISGNKNITQALSKDFNEISVDYLKQFYETKVQAFMDRMLR